MANRNEFLNADDSSHFNMTRWSCKLYFSVCRPVNGPNTIYNTAVLFILPSKCHFFSMWSVFQTETFGCLCLSCLYKGLNMWGISSQPDRVTFCLSSTRLMGDWKQWAPLFWISVSMWGGVTNYPLRPGEQETNESAVVTLKGDDASPRDTVLLGFPEDETCFCLTQRWREAPCVVTVFLFLLRTHLKGRHELFGCTKLSVPKGSFFILKSFPQLTLNIKIPLSVIFLPLTTRKQHNNSSSVG